MTLCWKFLNTWLLLISMLIWVQFYFWKMPFSVVYLVAISKFNKLLSHCLSWNYFYHNVFFFYHQLAYMWNFGWCRQARDVIKAIKKRLGSKHANSQLYAVMVSNCMILWWYLVYVVRLKKDKESIRGKNKKRCKVIMVLPQCMVAFLVPCDPFCFPD